MAQNAALVGGCRSDCEIGHDQAARMLRSQDLSLVEKVAVFGWGWLAVSGFGVGGLVLGPVEERDLTGAEPQRQQPPTP